MISKILQILSLQPLISKVFLNHLNIFSHNSSEQFLKQIPVLSCTPDPTTNSETTNPNFQYLFDQLEQVLQVFFFSLFGFTNLIGQNICENSGFTVSELVAGVDEQDIFNYIL